MKKKTEKSPPDYPARPKEPAPTKKENPLAANRPGKVIGSMLPSFDYENYDPLQDMLGPWVELFFRVNTPFSAFELGNATEQLSRFIPLADLRVLCRTYRLVKWIADYEITENNNWLAEGLKGRKTDLYDALSLICHHIGDLSEKKYLRESVAISVVEQLLSEAYLQSPAATLAVMHQLNPLTGREGRPKEIASNFLIHCLVSLTIRATNGRRNYSTVLAFLDEQGISSTEGIQTIETFSKRYRRIRRNLQNLKADYNNLRTAFLTLFLLRNFDPRINMTQQFQSDLIDAIIPPIEKFVTD